MDSDRAFSSRKHIWTVVTAVDRIGYMVQISDAGEVRKVKKGCHR